MGEPVHDFSNVDRVYDHILDIGLRPVVEISFMPHDLASDPTTTVFEYGAIVSPPKDWDRWADLVTAFTQHLVDRYGLEEVRDRWSFEVWNEANLEVFWSGTKEEYWKLYDVTVDAGARGRRRSGRRWAVLRRRRLGRGSARPRRPVGIPGGLRQYAHLRQPTTGLPADAGSARS